MVYVWMFLLARDAGAAAAGVPDVFRSPFQTSPLDLDTDAFYPARRNHLDAQLTRIADGQAGQYVLMQGLWGAAAAGHLLVTACGLLVLLLSS